MTLFALLPQLCSYVETSSQSEQDLGPLIHVEAAHIQDSKFKEWKKARESDILRNIWQCSLDCRFFVFSTEIFATI